MARKRTLKCGAVVEDGQTLPFLHGWGGVFTSCAACGAPTAGNAHSPETDEAIYLVCAACCFVCHKEKPVPARKPVENLHVTQDQPQPFPSIEDLIARVAGRR